MKIDLHKRISISEVQEKEEGTYAIVSGWAEHIKVIGKIAFIKLRDRTGYLQLVTTDKKLIKDLENLTKESVILVKGQVKKSKLKKGGNELNITDLEILSKAKPELPIDVTGKTPAEFSTRLDYRVLDLRKLKNKAIFTIRSKIIEAIDTFFAKKKFIKMQTPKLVGAGAEGGATLFVLDYYGKPAYLAQSQQLYKQLMNIAGFEKVYEIGPSFRAEKSHTTRHLSEFTHLDVEMSWIKSEEDLMKLEEELLEYILKYIRSHCKKELTALNVEINTPKLPLPRISYSEAIKMLQKTGSKIKLGEDIGTEGEKLLGELIKKKYNADAYFLTKFPWSLEVCKFYWMRDKSHGRGADLEFKGTEISTASQREHRYDKLVKQISEKNLKPEDFKYYTEPFRYGAPPHGGFGMGIDRLTQLILNLPNIREATLFPRDPERLVP
ncbi:aspartate--tRNA(Asn) ligase [Candidatus Woesearchaeota archaeon]|nr:aspartate--tRNA(Asn) ligase [Candidatus Woesearchaeota archaeon]